MKKLYKLITFLSLILSLNILSAQDKVYKFQTCGASGSNGPTQTQVNNTYTGANLLNGTVTINTQGIQEWTVPSSGYYKISIAGASGGYANSYGGRGQILTGEIFLTTGTVLNIVVGQQGSTSGCGSTGGGGGSFVVNASGPTPLFIAGGGAGVHRTISTTISSGDATYSNSGYNSYCGTGTGGTGGNGGTGSNNGWGGGGGGFYTDGTDGSQAAGYSFQGRGYAFVNGAQGGNSVNWGGVPGGGGFGGGGGTHGCTGGGGGGGGYSGGGGSNQNIDPNIGGGGGSFLANTVVNDSNLGYNIGDGSVVITKLASPCALNFDGTNDYVEIPPLNMSASNTMTIETWVKPSNITSNTNYEITRQDDANNPDWLLSFQDNGTILSFGLRTSNGYNELDVAITASNYTDGNWHHIAAVYNGSNKIIYVDGIQIGIATETGNITNNSSQNFIGSYNGSAEFFNGEIDELRFWNTARTLTQLNSNKYCEIGLQSNLIAIYHFNDGEPLVANTGNDKLNDESGNNYNGTLNNFGLSAGASSNWVIPALGQEITLFGNNVEIITGDITPTLLDHTDFGIGAFSRTFKIKNTGFANLKISGITITGTNASDFSITTSPSAKIMPDSSSNLVITFIPSALGARTATINITNIDCDESVFTFDIKGTGVTAKILDFDGSNDYVSIPHTSSQVGMSNITLEAWVKVGAAGTFRNIIMKGNYGYGIAIDNNNRLGYWSNSSYSNCPNFGTVPANTWTHVAVAVVQGVSATFYINGVNVGSSTISGHTTINSGSNDSLFLGYQGTGCACNYFKGTMEEVRIWNVARTQADIQSNMFCQLGTQSNLNHLYHFNQGIASGLNTGVNTLADSSGNANNGKLNNFALKADLSNWKLESAIGLEINMQGAAMDIVNNDTTPSLTDNTDFGTVGTGQFKTFTIQNTGYSDLNISSIYLTGADSALFTLSGITPSATIPALSSAVFTVTYTGVSSGIKKATVNIISNDCDEGKYSFAIKADAQLGSALAFDGNDNKITTQLTLSGSYTREAWIYPTNFNNYQSQIISADANIGCGASFGTNDYGYLSAGHPCVSSWNNVQDGTQLPLNTWTHAAVTYDATTQEMKLYKNGNLVSSNYVGNYGNETVSIGSWGNGNYWNGRIDEARVWNKVLPECQIQQNMNGELNGQQDGLVLNYHFNQGLYNQNNAGEDTVYDASGNGKNGYLNNFDLTDTFSNWIAPGGVVTGSSVALLPIEIDIKGNGVSISNNDITPSITDHTNWDTVAINQATVKTYTIYNLGTDTLYINNINTSGTDSADFTVQALTYPIKIAGGQNSVFTITLTPSSYLVKNAILTLNTNDCDEAIYTYNLKGFSKLLAPSPVLAMPSTICLGDSSKLIATAPLAGIKWYDAPTGGTKIGESMSDSGFYVTPLVKDTFYAESYAIVTGTKEYNIGLSELTGMTDICGGGIGVYTGYNGYTGSGNVGFTWNDATIAAITSATVEISAGIICTYTTFNTSLNSQPQPSIAVNSNCTCTPSTSVNGITSVTLNPADYNLGGTNQFTVDVPGAWFGLMPNSSIGNYYAKVIVTYLDTLRSTTRTPVVVNVGCNCNLTSALPTAAGTYTSSQTGVDGAYLCFCDASNNLLLALDTTGSGAVVGTTGVSLQIGSNATTAWNNSGGIVSNPNGGAIINRKWNVSPNTQPTSPVKVKYFFTQVEYDSIVARLATMGTTISAPTQLQMYKLFTGSFADPHAGSSTGIVLMNGSTPNLNNWTYSTYGTDHSAEYMVSSFSGGGGGAGGGGIPLPLSLINLKATPVQNKYIAINWQTTEETNTKLFEIQRSIDGKTFTTIGKINANINSHGLQSYIFNDMNVKGNINYFYRLNIIESDSKRSNSVIVSANITNKESINIYPNPTSSIVNIELPNTSENAQISITDAMGKLILNQSITGNASINIANLSIGMYTINIITETETKNFKLIKQ